MTTTDLQPSEYNPYYQIYIDKLNKTDSLIDGYKMGLVEVQQFFLSIPDSKLEFSYAEGKWTIKEIFQHIIDTERIFMYRCFRFARHDKTALVGFEQDDYIEPSQANSKSIEDLIEEYKAVRLNTFVFLKSLSDSDLKSIGNANGSNMSARAAAFVILGHEIWHMDVIKERYL